ncbi:MAG: hypothetical protein RL071_3805 [Pseudomonadota bacterium]|jgi:enoyl-CoA hydratase/carnithine racemase
MPTSPTFVTITLKGPGKNALSTPLLAQLGAELDAHAEAPLLLVGDAGCFSAGLDLTEVMRLEADEMATFLRLLERVCARLHDHPAPVVAAVNGHAIAGGAVLAACCDHRVGGVDPKARIGLNEVALGLRFPPGILRILQARLPAQHHGALLLGAGLHAPTDALRLGLLDELADDPVATAGARLQALAAHPPAAFAATKAALRAGVTTARPGEAEAFIAEVVPVWTSDALRARLRAVLRR